MTLQVIMKLLSDDTAVQKLQKVAFIDVQKSSW